MLFNWVSLNCSFERNPIGSDSSSWPAETDLTVEGADVLLQLLLLGRVESRAGDAFVSASFELVWVLCCDDVAAALVGVSSLVGVWLVGLGSRLCERVSVGRGGSLGRVVVVEAEVVSSFPCVASAPEAQD